MHAKLQAGATATFEFAYALNDNSDVTVIIKNRYEDYSEESKGQPLTKHLH